MVASTCVLSQDEEQMQTDEPPASDPKVARLHIGSNQFLPFRATRKQKRKLKNKSGIDNNVFRWT